MNYSFLFEGTENFRSFSNSLKSSRVTLVNVNAKTPTSQLAAMNAVIRFLLVTFLRYSEGRSNISLPGKLGSAGGGLEENLAFLFALKMLP